MTRLGMKEDDMAEIAKLVKRVAVDRENPASVREDVRKLISQFTTVKYAFEEGDEAYRHISL